MRALFEDLASITGSTNDLQPQDRAVHRWYSFVLSFPPHLVREYLQRFAVTPTQTVLDPFCGTGTTLVECKKLGIPSVGIEAIPISHFATSVKVDWTPDPARLLRHANQVAAEARRLFAADGDASPTADSSTLRTLGPDQMRLLIKDSISPLPLHRALVLRDCIEDVCFDDRVVAHELLALASVLPTEIGNLRFGPEVGVGQRRSDCAAVEVWLREVARMAEDLGRVAPRKKVPAMAYCGDARRPMGLLAEGSVDAVITSPPYPNEKDYTRIVRLESVLLRFMDDRACLRSTKDSLLRSNTRNVYKADEDHIYVEDHESIRSIADEIEARRIELGKDSGFERLYHRAVMLYFGGMKRHLAGLRAALRPGARLAYVVGDQASYLQVMIRTGHLLAEVAESLGYRVDSIDLFRTRMATATREQLREEVLVLRWPS